MLYIIGIGLKPEQLTLEAIEAIKQCDQVFLEDYTSEYSQGLVSQIESLTGKTFKVFGRREVEEGFESAILSATKNNIALLIFGNALTATTHVQILIDAKERGVKTKVIPGISVTNTIAETGMDEYKFGRTVTICFHTLEFQPDTFYKQIKQNQRINLHTLCLLDIKKDEKPKRLMNCAQGIEVLEKIAKDKKEHNDWLYVGMLGMGSEKQKVIVGREALMNAREVLDVYPQTLIIAGKLNEKEKEGLEKLHGAKIK